MPFAHTHREDFSKKNGVCQLFSRRFTGICRNLSISGKIKPLNSPPGVVRFVTDCCISFEISNKRLFPRLPPGGLFSPSCRTKATRRLGVAGRRRMRGAACLYEKAFPKRKAFSTFDFFTFRNSGIFHRLKRLHQERFSFHREAKKS